MRSVAFALLAALLAGALVTHAFAAAGAAGTADPAGADTASAYRTYVDGPWGQIHVRVAGREGDPTIILVHQMIWSSEQFRLAQPALAQRRIRSIAVDLPGYGASAGPNTPATASQYAETLIPVLQRFGLKSANLLGVNEGATIVAAFADAHPRLVRRLIVDGPVIADPLVLARYFAQPRAYLAPRADGSHLQSIWNSTAGTPEQKLSVEAMEDKALAIIAAGPRGWFAQEAAYKYDLKATLQRLRVPVLVITYPGQSFRAAALAVLVDRPDFAHRSIEWGGGVPSFDEPDPWAAAIAEYLSPDRQD